MAKEPFQLERLSLVIGSVSMATVGVFLAGTFVGGLVSRRLIGDSGMIELASTRRVNCLNDTCSYLLDDVRLRDKLMGWLQELRIDARQRLGFDPPVSIEPAGTFQSEIWVGVPGVEPTDFVASKRIRVIVPSEYWRDERTDWDSFDLIFTAYPDGGSIRMQVAAEEYRRRSRGFFASTTGAISDLEFVTAERATAVSRSDQFLSKIMGIARRKEKDL